MIQRLKVKEVTNSIKAVKCYVQWKAIKDTA